MKPLAPDRQLLATQQFCDSGHFPTETKDIYVDWQADNRKRMAYCTAMTAGVKGRSDADQALVQIDL